MTRCACGVCGAAYSGAGRASAGVARLRDRGWQAVPGGWAAETVTGSGVRYCPCGKRLARDHAGARCGVCERLAVERAAVPPVVPAGFWETQAFADAFGAQHMGLVARAYRRHPHHVAAYGRGGISQGLLGGWLGLTQAQVSRIENGPPIRNLDTLALWARVLQIPAGHLWFRLPGSTGDLVWGAADVGVEALAELVTVGGGRDAVAAGVGQLDGLGGDGRVCSGGGAGPGLAGPMDAVLADQGGWREVRRYLNHHRSELAEQAVRLYPDELRVGRTTLIAPPSWLPGEPVDLADIAMTWVPDVPAARVTGSEPETRGLRPLRVPGHQFDRYTDAVRYLDPPRLFENRASYRLMGLDWTDGAGTMQFGLGTYFDKLDVSEAVGHEVAAAVSRSGGAISGRDLPFRSLIGDPFDFRRRAVLPAVTTLLLRRTGSGAGFFLHWRDPKKVATATKIFDVIPAGEFQPSSIAPQALADDLDIWKNIVRELSEELLGAPEHDGSRGEAVDFAGWPLYRALCQARAAGKVKAVCLGAGLDTLTLAATILTAVVVDPDVFDELFGEAVLENAEGITVLGGGEGGLGIEFSESNVTRMVEREPIAAPGGACLTLAWSCRSRLVER
jgi:hypothetical protein